ncbi:GDSL-type esterase/lipase family protein [Streptomyces sp. NBC_01725]|uniref:GDSL-type esterase/lipase family protein n=1 Tax=Streptomyces sp. NBC_01725 TaxID=2975923 RepID=UPI002E2C27C8|nr:GDSL-type esterase/lipase family protein [Streptomyces sp. NBC_01725]
MRFMFVGDSMTIGRAGDFTWRYRMWRHLNAAYGGPFAIVGPRTGLYDADAPVSHAYGDPGFPAQAWPHLAGWGEGWQHMAPVVRDAVAAHRADILLVSLGLIDLGFYTDSDRTALYAREFIAEARAANPRVRIVLLPVIPNTRADTDPEFAAEVDRFNVLLAKAVADLDNAVSPLLPASRPASYDIHRDTYDGTHPGPSGEHLLAGAFADAMHQAWGLGAPYPFTRR